jgi:hypothetical protein
MKYYAITKYGTTKSAPFALIRMNQGSFEIYKNGEWSPTRHYDSILIGQFNDYDTITTEEAEAIMKQTV